MFRHHWMLWLFRRRAPLRHPAPLLDDDTLPLPDDRPLGCGWFDSSHDLQQGLQVCEADARGLAQLPLGDWLSMHLVLADLPRNSSDTPGPRDAGMIAALPLH